MHVAFSTARIAVALTLALCLWAPTTAWSAPFSCEDIEDNCCIDNPGGSKTLVYCSDFSFFTSKDCTGLNGGPGCGWSSSASNYQCDDDNTQQSGTTRSCPGTLTEFDGCDNCESGGHFCGANGCNVAGACGSCGSGFSCHPVHGLCQDDTTDDIQSSCCDGHVLWHADENFPGYNPGVATDCKALLGPAATCRAGRCVKYTAPRADDYTNTTSSWPDPKRWRGYDASADDKGAWCAAAPLWSPSGITPPDGQCEPDCWGKDALPDGCGGTCPPKPTPSGGGDHCWDATKGPWSDACNGGCRWNEYACEDGDGKYCITRDSYCDGYTDCFASVFVDEPPGCDPNNPPTPLSFCDWDSGTCTHVSHCLALGYYYDTGPIVPKHSFTTEDWNAYKNTLPPYNSGGIPGLLYAKNCGSGTSCEAGEYYNVVPCGTSLGSGSTQNCGGCSTYKTAPHGVTSCSADQYGPAGVNLCLCQPNCASRVCGDDGCGGTCGTCPTGICDETAGTCQCTPSCDQVSCGVSDGCGGVCGCSGADVCLDPNGTGGTCCTKSCTAGQECGDDGCGGTCGAGCADTFGGLGACDAPSGTCFCNGEGECSGKECGTDGCGNQCPVQCAAYTSCTDPPGTCGACTPQCAIQGWDCGDDGCGGTCGGGPNDGCGAGLACNSGTHQCECTPQCAGKTCGDDGCGGVCGTCNAQQNCFQDNCCSADCDQRACGDNGCGGSCGTCPSNQDICNGAGQCQCQPDCFGKQCGDDGCGGQCGDCSPLFGGLGACNGSDQCVCQADCTGAQCGDGGCADQANACGTCAGGNTCIAAQCCVPDCSGKSCGSDGCGGSCGTCGGGTGCNAGTGQCTCVPDCSGKVCGDDGCGGSCGTCNGPGEACDGTGQCECPGTCTGQECGSGACVTKCGSTNCSTVLGAQYLCLVGQCTCAPTCLGKTCGNDGCGGSCGSCGANEACVADNCACVPQCLNANNSQRECGPDACGQNCGTCEASEVCNDGTCYPADLGCGGKDCGVDLLGAPDGCGSCATGEHCQDADGTCRFNECPSAPTAGCCEGNVLKTCSGGGDGTGTLVNLDCSNISSYCGWDATASAYDCLAAPATGTGPTPQQCFGACTPNCDNKTCGDDGCGGTCGACTGTDAYCDFPSGTCKVNPCSDVPNVGCCIGANLVTCDAATQEATSTYCPAQGAGTCGWSASGGTYACGTPGTAEPSATYARACGASICVPSCTGKTCGSDGCGGTCGTCDSGASCVGSSCCTPDCVGKSCGSDGCGGTCGTCTAGKACNDSQGVCVGSNACSGVPFNVGCCDGQTFKVCDQAYSLTDVNCSTSGGRCGWDSKAQAFGCNTIGAPHPTSAHPWACAGGPICVPDCTGKTCGPDGCGGSCGACPSGESCDNATGACEAQCGGIPPEGCCGGDDDNTLMWCGKSGGSVADINAVDCGTAKNACGWNSSVGSYLCSTDGSTDPLGVHLKACPTITCTPDCTGKACGADGCGGSCGTCGTGQNCDTAGLCVQAPAACGTIDWKGKCTGNTLEFCSPDGRLITEDCDAAAATCAQNESIGNAAFSCVKPTTYPPAPTGTCIDSCGTFTAGATCQCDVDCAFRGDCCSDLSKECPLLGIADCGPSDACGNSNYLGTDSLTPPWRLPLTRAFENSGKPNGSREYQREPLDAVLPPGPPYSTDGLVAYIPHADVSAGHPGSFVVSTGVATAPQPAGKLGDSLNFADALGKPAKGVSTVSLSRPVGQRPHWAAKQPGGFTIALWAKIPSGAPNAANPLLSTWGPTSTTQGICASSREDDATVRIVCPYINGSQSYIKQIHGYFGDVVDTPEIPATTCAAARNITPTFSCYDRGFQASIKSCIGQAACGIDAWKNAGDADPCGVSPDPTIRSTSIVQAVCGTTSPGTGHASSLWVDGSADNYTVRYDVAGQAEMRSTASVHCDSPPCSGGDGKGWHHIALTFHPFPGDTKLGTTLLYVDGDLQGSRSDLPAPLVDQVVLGRGYVSTTSADLPYAVDDAAPGNRAAAAMLDEVFVYDRALSGAEVRGLRDKASTGAIRTWPAVDTTRTVQEKLWHSDDNTSAAAISADNILASDAIDVRLATAQPSVSVSGTAFNQKFVDAELSEFKDFTLAAWVRIPGALSDLTDGALITVYDSGIPVAGITSDSSCSGATVTGFVGGAATTASTAAGACSHGLASDRWTFVALWQKGGTQRVYIDGHFSSSVDGGAQLLFTGAATSELVMQTAPGVDVAWVTLFDRGLGPNALQTQRMQGPAVWLDGGKYNGFGETDLRLRDFASFDNWNEAATISRRATLWASKTAPAQGSESAGPITLSSSTWEAITIPADGRLSAAPGGSAGPFTWSGHAKFTNLPEVSSRLIRRYRKDATNADFASRLMCKPASDGTSHACQVFVSAATTAGTKTFASPEWIGNFTGQTVVDLDVVVSFDGNDVRVAIGSRLVAMKTAAPKPFLAQSGTYGAKLGLVHVPPYVTFDQFRMDAPDLTEAVASVEWHEVRIYPRALGDLELNRLTRRTCADLGCASANRGCLVGGDAGMAVCGPCKTGAEASAVAGGACLPPKAFLEVCGHSEECASGLCHQGRCRGLQGNEIKETCDATCDPLGRTCVKVDKVTGAVVKLSNNYVWDCSATCREYFQPPTENPTTGQCSWHPVTPADQFCDNEDQCLSGICQRRTRVVYDVSGKLDRKVTGCSGCGDPYNVSPKYDGWCVDDPDGTKAWNDICLANAESEQRSFAVDLCLPKDAQVCTRQHRDAIVDKTSGEVSCSQKCTEQLFNGKPLWKKSWSVMSPTACGTILKNAGMRDLLGLADAQKVLRSKPTLKMLGELLLGYPAGTPVVNADIAKLRKAGLGRELFRYISGKQSKLLDHTPIQLIDCLRYYQQQKGATPYAPEVSFSYRWDRRFNFNLAPCSAGLDCETGPPSPFYDPYVNKQICAPETFPNGTQCPPKGIDAPEVDDDEWCDSGYCSRASGTCEDGGALWQDTQSAARNDKKAGNDKQVTDIAIFKVVQDNRAGLATGYVAKNQFNGERDRWFSLKSSNSTSLGVFDLHFEAVRATSEVKAFSVNTRDAAKTSQQFILGLAVVKPPTLSSYVGSVSQSCLDQWPGDQFQGTGCTLGRLPDGKPIVPRLNICAPSPSACANVDDETGEAPKGSPGPYSIVKKTCLRKQMFIGSVPVTLIIGPTLDLCLSAGAVVDSETFEPGFSIEPSIAIGVDARAFPGTAFSEEFFQLGIKASVTLLGLGFPTTWGMQIRKQTKDSTGALAKNLYIVEYFRETRAQLTILSLFMGAYMEFGIGPLKLELDYELINFPGFSLSWSLQSETQRTIHLDLENTGSSY